MTIRPTFLSATLGLLFLAFSGVGNASATKGITVLSNAETPAAEATLFAFDDQGIPFTQNLRLELQTPVKHPDNPVVRRGSSGRVDEQGVQFYGSIVRVGEVFRMWYVAVASNPFMAPTPEGSQVINPLRWRPAYAESRDGIHWEKPSLGLVEQDGRRDNNLLLLEPAPLGAINIKVIHDPDETDHSRRYKMILYHAWWDNGKRGKGTIVPLVSGDGLRWRMEVKGIPVDGYIPLESMVLPP